MGQDHRNRIAAIALLAAALLPGCFGPGFQGIRVMNRTDAAMNVEVVATSGGHEVYNRTLSVPASNETFVKLNLADGTYQITARSGALRGSESVAIGRSVEELWIEVSSNRISVSATVLEP
jgi:hypothetical protein